MVLLATLPPEPGIANIVWRMVVCGIGFGFFQTPESERPDVERAAASQRQREQHRRDRAPDRTNTGAALAALCFAFAGHDGATLALALGAGFAALGSVMSFLRLAVARRANN